jgi:hypothetical protein
MRAWDSGARAHPHRSHMAVEAVEAVVGMGMVKASMVAVILLMGGMAIGRKAKKPWIGNAINLFLVFSDRPGEQSRAKACCCRAFLRIIEVLLKATPDQFDMSPEGESIKPEDEDVDTEDQQWDKTEGDETSVKQTDDEGT